LCHSYKGKTVLGVSVSVSRPSSFVISVRRLWSSPVHLSSLENRSIKPSKHHAPNSSSSYSSYCSCPASPSLPAQDGAYNTRQHGACDRYHLFLINFPLSLATIPQSPYLSILENSYPKPKKEKKERKGKKREKHTIIIPLRILLWILLQNLNNLPPTLMSNRLPRTIAFRPSRPGRIL